MKVGISQSQPALDDLTGSSGLGEQGKKRTHHWKTGSHWSLSSLEERVSVDTLACRNSEDSVVYLLQHMKA